jgi:hypothetical protein
VRGAAKENQGESKEKLLESKQKALDCLGFIRPIRDFSMGYGESKSKILCPAGRFVQVPARNSHFDRWRLRGDGFKTNTDFWFWEGIVREFWNGHADRYRQFSATLLLSD